MTFAIMSTAAVSSLATVPMSRMQLTDTLRASLPGLYSVPLRPLQFRDDGLVTEESPSRTFQQVAISCSGSIGSVVFVVRRPGCFWCREHGLQLTELASRFQPGEFGLCAIVKETGVDDQGLTDFHNQYYKYSTYRDEQLAVYAAFGNRKMKLRTWNPIRLYRGLQDARKRFKVKNIDGNYVGEGIIQGGVLVLDKSGKLRYSLEEDVGRLWNLDDIYEATQALKEIGSDEL